MTTYFYTAFASTYGSGAYNTSNFNGTNAQQTGNTGSTGNTTNTGNGTTTTTGSVAQPNKGNILTNTGAMVGMTVGLSGAIVVAAVLTKVVRRRKAATVPVSAEQNNSRHSSDG